MGGMDIKTESLRLTTSGGTMPAHLAAPTGGGPYPGVIVVMEAFGLNAHIKAVGERIAREGYVTVAPDLYHRFGSAIVGYDDVPKAIDLLKKLDDDAVMGEIRACVDALKARKDVRGDRIGIVGFCMGGRIAFLAAARMPEDIKAAVSFYGGGIGADQPGAPLSQAARITAPVLALWGETDAMIPPDQVKRVSETMQRLGKTYEDKVYAGAGHGFFCDERGSYHEASAKDAWTRLTGWFARHLR
jgi:carboxymethylenebutenolidase